MAVRRMKCFLGDSKAWIVCLWKKSHVCVRDNLIVVSVQNSQAQVLLSFFTSSSPALSQTQNNPIISPSMEAGTLPRPAWYIQGLRKISFRGGVCEEHLMLHRGCLEGLTG